MLWSSSIIRDITFFMKFSVNPLLVAQECGYPWEFNDVINLTYFQWFVLRKTKQVKNNMRNFVIVNVEIFFMCTCLLFSIIMHINEIGHETKVYDSSTKPLKMYWNPQQYLLAKSNSLSNNNVGGNIKFVLVIININNILMKFIYLYAGIFWFSRIVGTQQLSRHWESLSRQSSTIMFPIMFTSIHHKVAILCNAVL